ncbi:ribonuclease H-like domain-containing protein [Tanacetum coccineum]
MESQSETTQTVFALKLPILKSGDYDLWSMRMKQYLTHTDYALWEVIVNGDASAVASASAEGPIPPKTAEQKLARKNELKAKSTLLLAIPDEHLLKFHGSRMQRPYGKQSRPGLDKTYDRFQKLISQLEIHGEVISQEDANLKLLRSLPSAWNNIALIMRNKSDLDTLSMDDLYNNLKVYKYEIKGQSCSSSNSQNVAFVFLENTRSTNEAVNTAHEVSIASLQGQASSSTYADDVMFSIFANQSNSPQLDNEDLEQIDTDDLKEIDLKWQVAMLTMRVKIFLKKTGSNLNFNGKETVGFDKTKVKCYNCHRRGHFTRECRAPKNQGNRNRDALRRSVPVETPANALVVQDEIGLESLEVRIVVHEKNEVVYEKDITFLKFDVQVKDISIKDLKNQLEEVLKEKDDLKLKLEKFEESSKNLTKLINSQISDKDKVGLGYDSQINENEVVHSVFNSKESDVDDNPVNDRFKTDDSVYKTKVSENETSIFKTSKDIVEKPKTVRPSAPIIEDWDTDSDNDSVFRPKSDQTKPKFTKINFVKSDKNVKSVNKENTHRVNNVTTVGSKALVNAAVGNGENAVKSSACWICRPTGNVIDHTSKDSGSYMLKIFDYVDLQDRLKSDQGIVYSGCSRHMIGNKSFLTYYQEVDGGFVAFAGSLKGGKITGKGKIRTGKLDFEDVYFVKELKFNIFSVSQNSVLFSETECLVLSPDFKLLDESQVLLKVPRQNNMYSFDLKNVVPSGGLTCLFAKATIDESNLWHMRLGHINFKTMNKLMRGNLVRGLPSKLFENDCNNWQFLKF